MSRAGWSSGIFIGCMFIGLGIGMVFGHSGAGVLIGMGVGFILSTILGGGNDNGVKHLEFKPSIGSLVMSFIGLFFILLGLKTLGVLEFPEISSNILWGVILLLLGLAFIAGSIRVFRSR